MRLYNKKNILTKVAIMKNFKVTNKSIYALSKIEEEILFNALFVKLTNFEERDYEYFSINTNIEKKEDLADKTNNAVEKLQKDIPLSSKYLEMAEKVFYLNLTPEQKELFKIFKGGK